MKKVFAFILALSLICCSSFALADEKTKVSIGVTGAFYEDLWAPAIEALAKENIIVESFGSGYTIDFDFYFALCLHLWK